MTLATFSAAITTSLRRWNFWLLSANNGSMAIYLHKTFTSNIPVLAI
jgi:hypothetical protein